MKNPIIVATNVFLVLYSVVHGSEMTKSEFEIWKQLYTKMHPNNELIWKSDCDPRCWGEKNQGALDQHLAQIVDGLWEGVPWEHGFLITKHVSGPQVREALLRRAQSIEEKKSQSALYSPMDILSLASIATVVAKGDDDRAASIAHQLLAEGNLSSGVVRKCIVALEYVGGVESKQVLQEFATNTNDASLADRCSVATKVIDRRLSSQGFGDSEIVAIRAAVETLIAAIESESPATFRSIASERVFSSESDEEIVNNVLRNPAIAQLVERMRNSTTTTPVLGKVPSAAQLGLGEGHRLDFLLEKDKWRVVSIR